MNIQGLRTYIDPKPIELCPHITVEGQSVNDASEYTEVLQINCQVCGIKHLVEILVN